MLFNEKFVGKTIGETAQNILNKYMEMYLSVYDGDRLKAAEAVNTTLFLRKYSIELAMEEVNKIIDAEQEKYLEANPV